VSGSPSFVVDVDEDEEEEEEVEEHGNKVKLTHIIIFFGATSRTSTTSMSSPMGL